MTVPHVFTFSGSKPGAPIIGEIYYDVKTIRSYVWTGSTWAEIASIPIADIEDPQKIKEEKLCQEHPGLAELRDELKKAQEKFNTYKALVDNYEEPK